jgi:hypothetical protein
MEEQAGAFKKGAIYTINKLKDDELLKKKIKSLQHIEIHYIRDRLSEGKYNNETVLCCPRKNFYFGDRIYFTGEVVEKETKILVMPEPIFYTDIVCILAR